MKLNLYFLFVFIYFFINSLGLPFGLTWMSLFAPLFYVWILIKRKRDVLLPFLAILLPFAIVHLTSPHVQLQPYTISLVNLLMVYIFSQAVYTLVRSSVDLEWIFTRILIINFILCLLAIPIYFTPLWDWLWMEQSITTGIGDFRRLKMFTYEPSYYSLLFIPFFFYFLLRYFSGQNKLPPALLLPMIFLPLILSFSIGVLGAAFIALLITGIVFFKKLIKHRRVLNALIYFVAGTLLTGLVLVVFFRDNALFLRLANIIAGEDTSGKGRTIDAFILAIKIMGTENETWGIGLGQIKTMGYDIIRSYYLYYTDHPVAIPNAVAETLTIFGWVGLCLRLFIEAALFFITKPWTSYYRLLLFIFIFIYQFTGSYITNGAEYVVWVLAFTRWDSARG